MKAIKAIGWRKVTAIHATTDHGWSRHQIFLESAVIDWLAGLK